MERFVEFFGSEDALTMIIALSFIGIMLGIMLILFIYDKVRMMINRKRRDKNNKELEHKKRIEKRRVLEQKAFDFAMVYYSVDTNYNDENIVVYKGVFV